MPAASVSQALIESLSRRRDQPAVFQRGREYTVGELVARAEAWADYLRQAGVGPGSVCAAAGEFSFNTAAFLLATLMLRCTVVPLAPDSGENSHLLSIACADVFVDLHRDDLNQRATTVEKYESALLRDFLSRGKPGIITFTSGSSGEPKGVLHDFDRALANIVRFDRKGYRSVTFLLWNHMGGINSLISCLASNGGVAVFPEHRTAEDIAALVAEARVELLPVTPTFLALFVASRCHEHHDMSSIKLISYGAEPMPQPLLERMNRLFPNARFHQTYGTTELCLLQTKSRSSDSLWVKLGGDGFDIRVIDGQLYIRSDFAMLGYLNAPSPFLEDGWLATGDRVEQDGEWLRFLGRDSDIINVGGEKVTPLEIESVLFGADNICDVWVHGEKDALFGARVVANVVLVRPEDPIALRRRLRALCLEKLARYKVPVKFNIVTGSTHTGRFKKVRPRSEV